MSKFTIGNFDLLQDARSFRAECLRCFFGFKFDDVFVFFNPVARLL